MHFFSVDLAENKDGVLSSVNSGLSCTQKTAFEKVNNGHVDRFGGMYFEGSQRK